jgi:hypothetical protein
MLKTDALFETVCTLEKKADDRAERSKMTEKGKRL